MAESGSFLLLTAGADQLQFSLQAPRQRRQQQQWLVRTQRTAQTAIVASSGPSSRSRSRKARRSPCFASVSSAAAMAGGGVDAAAAASGALRQRLACMHDILAGLLHTTAPCSPASRSHRLLLLAVLLRACMLRRTGAARAMPAFLIASAAETAPRSSSSAPSWRHIAANLAAGATAGCAVEAGACRNGAAPVQAAVPDMLQLAASSKECLPASCGKLKQQQLLLLPPHPTPSAVSHRHHQDAAAGDDRRRRHQGTALIRRRQGSVRGRVGQPCGCGHTQPALSCCSPQPACCVLCCTRGVAAHCFSGGGVTHSLQPAAGAAR